jgi:hypothetical protein
LKLHWKQYNLRGGSFGPSLYLVKERIMSTRHVVITELESTTADPEFIEKFLLLRHVRKERLIINRDVKGYNRVRALNRLRKEGEDHIKEIEKGPIPENLISEYQYLLNAFDSWVKTIKREVTQTDRAMRNSPGLLIW